MEDYDPFVSPIQMEDYILKHMPPVRIFVGSSDPLRDDSIRLLDKLRYNTTNLANWIKTLS
jgi:acetyl esterase/lipase